LTRGAGAPRPGRRRSGDLARGLRAGACGARRRDHARPVPRRPRRRPQDRAALSRALRRGRRDAARGRCESATPTPMNVRDLIERYNAAWNAQDLGAIDALHDPEIVFHNHTADERAEGAGAVREHIAEIFRNNPTLRFATRSLYVGVDFAVCEWTASTGSKE